VDLEDRVPAAHPLRTIRVVVNEALMGLSRGFRDLYARIGRPSITPERLLRALLLQAFYSIRSERLLMEQLEYTCCIGGSRHQRCGVAPDRLPPPTATGSSRAMSHTPVARRFVPMRPCGGSDRPPTEA
jgi:hypothetical protein